MFEETKKKIKEMTTGQLVDFSALIAMELDDRVNAEKDKSIQQKINKGEE